MCVEGWSIVKKSCLEEIKAYLNDLGSGNHEDNMRSLSSQNGDNYYLLELSKSGFLNLVFLQNSEVRRIAPEGESRTLQVVACRALQHVALGNSRLSSNWDLVANRSRLETTRPNQKHFTLPALVLRDVKHSERENEETQWYIQDGCHRALAYAMAVLKGDVTYQPQRAFCFTARLLGRVT